jgi:hypothetical protein
VTAVSWTEGGLKGEKAVPVSMDWRRRKKLCLFPWTEGGGRSCAYFHGLKGEEEAVPVSCFFSQCARKERIQSWSCLACPHVSARKPLDGYWWILVRKPWRRCYPNCHFNLLQRRIWTWREHELMRWEWY